MNTETKPVAWMDNDGSLHKSPRHILFGLVDDSCGSQDVLWSGHTLDEAGQAWREITARQADEVRLTGWNCGVLARHDELAWRYAEPKGTFACPICWQETPHHHSTEEVAEQREVEQFRQRSMEKRWQEIDAQIAALEARYQPRQALVFADAKP